MSLLRYPLVLAAILAFATVAFAAQSVAFDRSQFVAAQAAGHPILVDIRASWCPVCAAQEPIIEKLAADPAYKDLLIFRVDFDSQKDAVHSFGARSQSTLIAYRGATEMARSVGDTNFDSIARLLRSALN